LIYAKEIEMTEEMQIGTKTWSWGTRTYIMGILNITPDSFSDGGRFNGQEVALEHASQMVAEGADIIDVGGESTRPGHTPVTAEEELARITPIIEVLSRETDVPISVDTYKAATAAAAIQAGAHMINDIWGLKADPEMAQVVAHYQVPVCLMHNRAQNHYDNLIEEIISDLADSIELALKAGVKDENIIIDPGLGFGKNWRQNFQVMSKLEQLSRLGYPVLLGPSRKLFTGKLLDLPVDQRLEGTLAATVVGITKGIDIVRVYDVRENKRAAVMADAMVRLAWIRSL
jgi:dihydropteroate synthase